MYSTDVSVFKMYTATLTLSPFLFFFQFGYFMSIKKPHVYFSQIPCKLLHPSKLASQIGVHSLVGIIRVYVYM